VQLAKVSRDNNRIYDLSFMLCRLYPLLRGAASAVKCIPDEFDLVATDVRGSVARSQGRIGNVERRAERSMRHLYLHNKFATSRYAKLQSETEIK
jgi:hypothetical protein